MPGSSKRLRKPELLRMLFEKLVLSSVLEDLPARASRWRVGRLDDDRGAGVAEDEVAVAVAAVQVAGGDLRVDHQHARAPGRSAPRRPPVWMPKVADEQATFMSKPKPSMPSASCTSTAIAG